MRKAITLFLGFLLLIAGGVFLFLPWKGEEKGASDGVSYRLSLKKTHIVGRYNGKLQWELEADKTERSSDERFTYLWGIKNGIFHEWEKGKLRFAAEKAIYDNLTKELQLEDVHISCEDLNAQAPILFWDGERGLIICEKGADFRTPNASLKGYYIELDLRNSSMLVNKGILIARVKGKL